MRQAPRSRLAHTATGGKSGAERSSSQVPLFIDHRRPNGRSVRLFFVSRTNKFAVCKTSSPGESACGPMQTANGRKDRGPVCAGRLHGDDGGPNGPGGTGRLPCCDAPCRSAPAARARRIRRGSPPAKFEAAAVDVEIHAVDEARLLGGQE